MSGVQNLLKRVGGMEIQFGRQLVGLSFLEAMRDFPDQALKLANSRTVRHDDFETYRTFTKVWVLLDNLRLMVANAPLLPKASSSTVAPKIALVTTKSPPHASTSRSKSTTPVRVLRLETETRAPSPTMIPPSPRLDLLVPSARLPPPGSLSQETFDNMLLAVAPEWRFWTVVIFLWGMLKRAPSRAAIIFFIVFVILAVVTVLYLVSRPKILVRMIIWLLKTVIANLALTASEVFAEFDQVLAPGKTSSAQASDPAHFAVLRLDNALNILEGSLAADRTVVPVMCQNLVRIMTELQTTMASANGQCSSDGQAVSLPDAWQVFLLSCVGNAVRDVFGLR